MKKPVVVITIGQKYYKRMISKKALDVLSSFADVVHHSGSNPATKEDMIRLLKNADACITSWEVAPLDEDVINSAQSLKAMAHMGGSVKRFVSEALWKRGVKVFSAAPALARDVAETTVGLMIIGAKQILPLAEDVRNGGWRSVKGIIAGELHHKIVGIIGASRVGRNVISLLKPFGPEVLLYDPFVTFEEAKKLGVKKMELDTLIRNSDIISLHAPLNEKTKHMLNRDMLSLIKNNAVLINTARGGLVDEDALIEELKTGRFFAFLDVTDSEPLAKDSPLRSLKNVLVTPHIAGCIENCTHMSELAVEELRRFFSGEPVINEITPDMFPRIA